MSVISSADNQVAPDLPAAAAPGDDEPGYWWAATIWVVVAGFAAIAIAKSISIGIPLRDPHGEIFVSRITLSAVIFAVLVLVDAAVRAGKPLSVRRTLRVLRSRWSRKRLLLAWSALLAYHIVYFSYHNLKSWDVFNTVQDQALENADKWLFFGHSPANLLHELLGTHIAAYVLMVIYESFSTVMCIAFVASVVLTSRIRDGYVFMASAIWVWILGVGSYYLIPSLGPFHIAPQDFASLPHTMIQDTQARYMAQRAYLLAHPQAHDAFAQVSAFASLHVAVTTLLLLMAYYYGLRKTTIVAAVYVACVIVATVYLGWHFFVDDIAGVLIAVIGVRLGTWMIYPHGRPPKETPADRTDEVVTVGGGEPRDGRRGPESSPVPPVE